MINELINVDDSWIANRPYNVIYRVWIDNVDRIMRDERRWR